MNCRYMAISPIGIYLNLDTEFLIKNGPSEFLFGSSEIQIAGILLRYDNDIISLGEIYLI